MTSCVGESFETEENHPEIVDGMIRVDFTVNGLPFQTDTKAFGISPEVRSMKVVVFDQHGVYISQCDAELSDITTSNNVTTGKYSANFPVSDEQNAKRIIHFLVNYNGEIEYGTELEVISKLIVSGNTDCYWQRVEVTDLTAVEQDGNMVLQHQSQLQGINLIRNFCAFTVSSNPETSKLDILSAAIYNVPDRGTVAPYSSDNSSFVGGNGFVTGYQNYNNPNSLITAGYKAAVPIEYNLTDYSSNSVLTDKDGSTITLFSYERENPLNDPPFILVSGKWGADEAARKSASVTYYKINLRDVNDEYFPLLRNFRYKINIKEVKRAGASTIEEALASIGSGEVSTDIRFSGLTDISNGEARMQVTTTDVVLVSDAPYRELLYKFFPDVNSDSYSNGAVTISLGEAGETGSVFQDLSSIVMGSDNSEGWRELTCYPKAPGEAIRKQSVILTGTYRIDDKDYTISRTINFTLRQKPALTAECLNTSMQPTTVVDGTKETPFVLKIGIPSGLPSSVFPLDLKIEAQQGTISPNTSINDNILPISSGKSMFGTKKPAFAYTKSVQYNSYEKATAEDDGYKYFYAYFKTNIAASATDIIVSNHYFLPAVTYFTNGGVKTFSFLPAGIEQTSSTTAMLTFNMQTVTPVTINLGTTATPSGTNAARMAATGTPGVYTYTPASTGIQQIGLALGEDAGYRIVLSASNYDPATLRRIGVISTGFTFDGSNRTDDKSGVIPGFETTLKLPASSVNGISSGKVSFTINGTKKDASLVDGYYSCTYTVPSSQSPGQISVSVTATEDGSSSTADLGTISVWKQKITVENTAITKVAGFADQQYNWNNPTGKKIWTGIVLRNVNTTTRYLTGGDSFANNQPGSTFTVNHCFQTNGTNYLKTYSGKYLSTSNLNASAAQTNVTITYNGSAWVFTDGTIGNYTNRKTLQTNTNTAVRWNTVAGRNIADTHRWTAYPVTVEYVAP